jgi:acyl carrier protein
VQRTEKGACMDDTSARARKIICRVLEIRDAGELDDQIDFKDMPGLEVDSLTALDILAGIEKEFKIKIDQKLLPRLTNVANTVTVIEEVVRGVSVKNSVV